MATTVTYKGQTLTTVENQTKTLQTAGTWVEDDFTLTDVSGGGATEPEQKAVSFIDYDGTLVYSYDVDEFLAMATLPANPSHTGLTAQGWNWTLADAKDYVQKFGCLVIGQNYTTSDGKTRFYITLDDVMVKYRVSIMFYASVKGGVTVDWGDGNTETPQTNVGTVTRARHTYASAGSYVITLDPTSGNIELGYNGSNVTVNNEDVPSSITSQGVTKVEIGANVTKIHRQGFQTAFGLETISIPTTCVEFGTGANGNVFNNAPNLKCVVMPSGTTKIIASTFAGTTGCPGLKFVCIPKSVTTIEQGAFGACSANMRALTLPPGLTSLPSGTQNIGNYMYGLKYLSIGDGSAYTYINQNGFRNAGYKLIRNMIIIPDTVTTINTYAFQATRPELGFHLKSTTPPTLANTNAFSSWNGMKIYVPYSSDHSVLAAYQTATNWSTYASYMLEDDVL